MHANFIENEKQASAEEFKTLVKNLTLEIERISGLKFEFEVKVY